MSIQLRDVIDAARSRDAAFHQTRIPHAVVGAFLSDYQNELIARAVERDALFMAQKMVVVLNFGQQTAPGMVGAGTGDGLPGAIDPSGTFAAVQQTTGTLVDPNVTSADGAQVAVPEHVVSSATPTTLRCLGIGRTTNQDLGRILHITAGTGIGQEREIISNTADTWVISSGTDGLQWATTPDASSLFEVVIPAYGSSLGVGVVTSLPATAQERGFMVKLDPSGVPYIDWTRPLVANVETGVPLPAMLALLSGMVHYTSGDHDQLTITTKGRRDNPARWPAVMQMGQVLYFPGWKEDWVDVQSIELDYVPIAPPFTELTDYFLLPDHARMALVGKAAAFMAMRCSTIPDVQLDPSAHVQQGQRAEDTFLMTIRLTRRARRILFREGDY
jgi:hypothetical protein